MADSSSTNKPAQRRTKLKKSSTDEVKPIWGASAAAARSSSGSASASVGRTRNAPTVGAPAFSMNTTIGQHILQNPQIAQAIVDKSGVLPTDTVLEVGPGTGNLTMRLLAKASTVAVIEMDPRMARELSKRCAIAAEEEGATLGKLEVTLGDSLKVPFPARFDLCVSNMPYQISSPIIYKLLGHNRPPRASVLMFQHEFNLRLLARPGDSAYGRISATVQRFATVSLVMKVGRSNFRPPPAVESSVVRIEMKPFVLASIAAEDEEQSAAGTQSGETDQQRLSKHALEFREWDGLLRICFVRKNKTISACFKSSNVLDRLAAIYTSSFDPAAQEEATESALATIKSKVGQVLADTGFASKRSNKCTEADFETLLAAFRKEGVSFAAMGDLEDEQS